MIDGGVKLKRLPQTYMFTEIYKQYLTLPRNRQ